MRVAESNKSVLDVYLKEISKKALFTREEEFEVAVNVDKWTKRIEKLESKKPRLQKTKNQLKKDLIIARINLDKYTKKMLEANYRLVVSVAKKYSNSFLQLTDFIEEGNLGLYKAISRFDPYRGFRFSTFAIQWIKQNITKAIRDKSRMIRVPVHIDCTISKYKKLKAMHLQEKGQEAQYKHIESYMNIPVGKMTYYLNVSDQFVSLNSKGADLTNELGDSLSDSNSYSNPQQTVMKNSLKESIIDILKRLKEVEKKIIIMRYGLFDTQRLTLDDIGQQLKITRERVRQIQSSALKKIRNFSFANELKYYLN